MDGAGGHFLAGAGLTFYQDWRIGLRNMTNELHRLMKRRGTANQIRDRDLAHPASRVTHPPRNRRRERSAFWGRLSCEGGKSKIATSPPQWNRSISGSSHGDNGSLNT